MDRFLDGADPSKKARSKVIQAELNVCRERINNLTHDKVCTIHILNPIGIILTFHDVACSFCTCSEQYRRILDQTGRC